MNFGKWFLTGFVMLCSFAVQAHDYYVSVAILDYNAQSKSIELTFKFTAHDVEKVFEEQHYGDLRLGTSKELANADSLLNKYIAQHFQIEVKGIALSPKFLGKEVELDESLFVYMEIPNVDCPDRFVLTNDLLTEVFDAQENINHINFGKQQLSITFNQQLTSKEITIE